MRNQLAELRKIEKELVKEPYGKIAESWQGDS
jgi:hypothetical protein